jgi:hypothetical protein
MQPTLHIPVIFIVILIDGQPRAIVSILYQEAIHARRRSLSGTKSMAGRR